MMPLALLDDFPEAMACFLCSDRAAAVT